MKLTYIRWSMTIIETGGLTIVTDPVFRMMGIRQAPKTYTFRHMPRPDLVFVSHTHVDHFEPATLRKLPGDTPVWIPAGKAAEPRLRRIGLKGLRDVRAWESEQFRGVRLTTVPAQHMGGELGLVIEGDRTVYFAGDTSFDREMFRAIGHRWQLDAVLLPIGDLRTLGIPVGHIGPRNAPRALRALGEPRVVVPTHYSGMSLFPLVAFGGTPRKLGAAIDKAGLGTQVGTTRPLETVEI
jgi:L-ascorbate metabolism protein UlaG (beta-lactamase superfamily)